MKLKIEYVDIDTIKPYKNNAKKHPQEQIEQIKKSIQEFGNNDPIAVWNNEIVEGHGRYLALQELGGGYYSYYPSRRTNGRTKKGVHFST